MRTCNVMLMEYVIRLEYVCLYGGGAATSERQSGLFNKVKYSGVEFRHSTRNASRARRKVGNGLS